MVACVSTNEITLVAGFLDFALDPQFWITTKHDVSESGSGIQWLKLALSKELNRIVASLPLPQHGKIHFLKRFVFKLFKIPDHGQSPQTQYFWELHAIVRTL
jgi:hypothetical protein